MPEDFEHRRAATTDAQTLSTLATQVFLDTYATHGINDALAREVATVYSIEMFERRLRDADVELLLATSGGYTVGFVDIAFATLCPVPGVRGAEVFRLYVQRPFLRRGLGRKLMAKAEASARARGLESIWLTAWAGNHGALAFYQSLGFRDIGTTEYVIDGVGHENRVLCKTFAR
ncbi:GNAT family N-acetyltransferase [Hydrogenophaga pseudoflava]|jgi:ribosomal protein S18 acetylase RimI-like enzyme|uniref:Protease synthase and sporulation negative regulatory protein PAI 1 n=1 Tax=Hydrogenophaga pseudoflava TaxID=47421 RepID=A0A4P6X6M8_HYDPS|nr:GNAT family N-acetyltransferase [Hydrogenophaga pseudoflava]QBM29374.1 Protease synthase and sporulation negative regulatory protein PAI 1 [Hydrogenophaga pseudoflava]